MENREKEVMAVVQNYIDGTYRADVALLEGVFHKGARMSGYLGKDLVLATPEPFIEDIKSHPSMLENKDLYKAEVKALYVTGNIASVILSETGFFGSVSLETHFHLIKDGEWKIISKTFTTVA